MDVISEFSSGRIFFANGAPIHATAGSAMGDQAVREIVSWQVARVVFTRDEVADARTVSQPLEYLMREAANLLEQKRYLTNFGLCYEFSLTRAPASERQAATLQGGLYHMLYNYFDERKHTLADCIRDLRLEPCDWAPAIAYMLGQRLLQAHPPHLSRAHGLRFLGSGRNAIEEQAAKLLSPRIGIYKYTSLLLLLKRELLLHRRIGAPFSLISFEFQAADDSYGAKLKWLSAEMVKAVSQKFDLLKRPLDLFAHFESLEYALLLPNTDLAQAKIMANILLQALVKVPAAGGDDSFKVDGVCGIATFPMHGANLERFLACAKLARKEAKRLGWPMATTTADDLAVWEVDDEERVKAERAREKTLRPQRFPTGKEPPKIVEVHLERPFELPDLLIRAGVVTPDHIEQSR
ncbi:MAG: diguanylate cyclase domain-containing protein, partial [Terriglobales bacterium]